MKDISVEHAHAAMQMVLGVEAGSNRVVIALEAPLEPDGVVGWLAYGADAAHARHIAQMLLHGADVIEGKDDNGHFDSEIEGFKDHHGR